MILFYLLNQKAVILPKSIALWSKYQILKLNKTRLWHMCWTVCSQIACNAMCLSAESDGLRWCLQRAGTWSPAPGKEKVPVGETVMASRQEL